MNSILPEKLGDCIDLLYSQRERRLALQRELDELKAQEEFVKGHIIGMLHDQELNSGTGDVATASITHRIVAQVEDWDAVYGYVLQNRAFDLLHKRISDTAYRDRLEQDEPVPGIKPFEVEGLSLVKASTKSEKK
jgi:hypothetical protein